ncbi:hypothetical protein WICPIJ_003176, partial [Wickerhamomyces pijperi]
LTSQLPDAPLDVLILNAGIAKTFDPVAATARDMWLDHFVTNTVGPIMVFQQLQHLLERSSSPQVYFVSTMGGSIQSHLPFPSGAYGASKAALNFIARKLSEELPHIKVVSVHPGMVATEKALETVGRAFAGNEAVKAKLMAICISPEQSAANIIAAIHSPIRSGRFIRVDDQSDIPF